MNWTGGRLRRQSHNRRGSLSRIQKKHFAKARLKQRDACSRQTASRLFRPINFSRLDHDQDAFQLQTNRFDQNTAERDETRSHQIHNGEYFVHRNQSQPLSQGRPPVPQSLTTLEDPYLRTHNRISAIENVKLRLLHQGDWVGLSPTRPLHMKFPSVEEKEGIGKRRRLSKADETRQNVLLTRPIWSMPFRHEQFNASRIDALPDINIQINEPGPIPSDQASQDQTHDDTSSDSMLFDMGNVESSVLGIETPPLTHAANRFNHPLAFHDPKIQSNEGYYNISRHVLPSSYSEYGSEHSGSDKSLLLQEPEEKIAERRSSPEPSNLPVRHRFTLDDQILAVQTESLRRSSEFERSPECVRQETSIRHPLIFLSQQAAGPRINDSFTPGTERRNPQTNHTDSVTSNPTESEWLPQTQKISRQLPPSQRTGRDPYVFTTPQRLPADLQRGERLIGHEESGNDRVFSRESNGKETSPIIFGQRITGKELLSCSHHSPTMMNQPCHRGLHAVSSVDEGEPHSDTASRSLMARPLLATKTRMPSEQSPSRGHRVRSINIHTRPHSPSSRQAIHDRDASSSFDARGHIAPPSSHLPSSTTTFRFPTYWTPRKNERVPAVSPIVTTVQQASPDEAPSSFQRPQPPPPFTLHRRVRRPNGEDGLINGDGSGNGELQDDSLPFFNTPFRR